MRNCVFGAPRTTHNAQRTTHHGVPYPGLMIPVLAHQGGWDELLLFVVPILLVLGWVRWAERRARRRKDEAPERGSNMPDDVDA